MRLDLTRGIRVQVLTGPQGILRYGDLGQLRVVDDPSPAPLADILRVRATVPLASRSLAMFSLVELVAGRGELNGETIHHGVL